MKGGMGIRERARTLVHEEETHFLELAKHFFRQFFENEFVARGSEARITVVHVLALLAVPPIAYTLYLIPYYDGIGWNAPSFFPSAALVDHCRFVTLTMVVTGFIAVLEWDALFLDRRDFSILTPLPIRTAAIFAAKIAAMLAFLSLFIVDLAGVPTLAYPLVETMGIRGTPVSFLRLCAMVASHAIAVCCGCVFIFLLVVAVQGLMINILGSRAFKLASLCFQLSAMVALLLALLLLPSTSAAVPAWEKAHGGGWFFWYPPLWFVGVYETFWGSGSSVFHALAWTALAALGLAALTAGVTYILSYKRHTQRVLEAVEMHGAHRFGVESLKRRILTHLVVRRPVERAIYLFVTNTFMRSSRHRLYLSAYVGAGSALAAFGMLQWLAGVYTKERLRAALSQPNAFLLAIPLILSLFLLSGMRIVFSLPAELRANWVFQMAEDENRADCLAAVRKVMSVRASLLLVALFPFYAVLWGWAPALQQLIFTLILSLILIELLLINFRKIPFTCSYQPGKANITVLGALYASAFAIYPYAMATLERWLLYDGARWAVFMLLLLAALAGMVTWRRTISAAPASIVYEDAPNPEVQTLGLGT